MKTRHTRPPGFRLRATAKNRAGLRATGFSILRPKPEARSLKPEARSLRRGFLSIELAMTLPILGVILLGLFEFSMLFAARGSVVEACRVGARMASLPGVGREDVESQVRKVLEPRLQRGLRVDWKPGGRTGDVVSVAVSVPMRSASPDLLWPIGYRLRGRRLYAETRMIKE